MKNSSIYGSKRITRTGDDFGKPELLPLRAPERISDRPFTDHLKGGCLTVEVRFAEMTGDCYYSERAHSPCKFSMLLFGQFYKIKLVFKNTDSTFGVFFRCFACTV